MKDAQGREIRCEHATTLVKGSRVRATTGDAVEFSVPEKHDKGIIDQVLARRNAFVRKDPAERSLPQVLAANFDKVFVVEPLVNLNVRRLERELVLAPRELPLGVVTGFVGAPFFIWLLRRGGRQGRP